MKGAHHIIIQSSHLKYEFDIVRNITIIQGDSATGKTTLVDMIREYNLNGPDTGITVSCDVRCRLIEGNTWKEQLDTIKGSIVFVDEGNRFIVSKEFAEEIKKTDNYYVIITRESLNTLPYSVTEIYGMRSSGKYNSISPVYHSLYRIYGDGDAHISDIDSVIVEDSNSGYQFFRNIMADTVNCISAKSKDKIFSLIADGKIEGKALIIADGAAFGSQMARVYDLVNRDKNISLYLPESFEWLILKSNVFQDASIRTILESPEDYIYSEEYFSWERYFTHLLIEKSSDTYLKYTKGELNESYLQEKIAKKIIEVLPEDVARLTNK